MQITASARRTATAAALILVIAAFWLAGGHRAGTSAALGVAMLVLFFAGGRAPMILADTAPAGLLFLLIATGYVLRVVLLLAVLLAFGDAGWVDRSVVAATVVTGSLLWTAALVRSHLTSRQPTLVIEAQPMLASAGASK
jgi:ATP synthase protein I